MLREHFPGRPFGGADGDSDFTDITDFNEYRSRFGISINPSGEVDLTGTVIFEEPILIPAQVPAPGSIALLGLGLVALGAARRLR